MNQAKLAWHKTRRFTFSLLLAWFFTTFIALFFARELDNIVIFGWSLSFFMAAQGLTLFYLALLGLYAWRMRAHESGGKA